MLPDVFSAIFTAQETRAAQSLTLLGKPMVCVTVGILNTNVIGSLYRVLITLLFLLLFKENGIQAGNCMFQAKISRHK